MRWTARSRPNVWRRVSAGCGLSFLAVAIQACAVHIDRPKVVIGTGRPSGIYYSLSGFICRLVNLESPNDVRRCAATPAVGPVANVDALHNGRADIAIVPSNMLADTVAGEGPFAARAPESGLRVLFTGHADTFTIGARREPASIARRNCAAGGSIWEAPVRTSSSARRVS